jgi:hypothetical protein
MHNVVKTVVPDDVGLRKNEEAGPRPSRRRVSTAEGCRESRRLQRTSPIRPAVGTKVVMTRRRSSGTAQNSAEGAKDFRHLSCEWCVIMYVRRWSVGKDETHSRLMVRGLYEDT